jgi:hypothetical protein
MAHFVYSDTQKGFRAINLDLVREVTVDVPTDTLSLHFDLRHRIQVHGKLAQSCLRLLTRLKYDAALGTGTMRKEAKAKKLTA